MMLSPDLFSYIRKQAGGAAEDLLQEVAAIAVGSFGIFEGKDYGDFRRWCFRVAKNKVLQHYRAGEKQKKLDAAAKDEATETYACSFEESLPMMRRPAVLKRLFDGLNEQERTLVYLRNIKGKSYKELAAILGKSEAALMTAHHRLISKMHSMLAEIKNEDDSL